jgi:type I restriction enzyme S subunit
VSELPEGWAIARLRDVSELLNGRAYKQTELLETGKYPVLRVGNLFSNPKMYYSNLELEEDKYCDRGDLIYAWSASFGPRIWEGGKHIFHYHIWRVELDDRGVDKRFLYYWMQWDKDNIKAEHGTGSTMIHVTKGDMEDREIALPPFAEQRRIVTKLDALAARTARARADLAAIPRLASRFKAAVLVAAFTGALTATWRAFNSERACDDTQLDRMRQDAWRSLSTRRGKYASPVEPDWRPDVELPKGWRWASVDQLVHLVQYGTSAKTADEGDVPVLRMGNIVDGDLDMTRLKFLPSDHDEFPELLLARGDLLFNRTNSAELVGKTAVYRGSEATSFASYLIRLRTSGGYVPQLLAAYINSPFGRAWVASATSQQVGQANVNGSKLRSLGVPLMPMPEQQEAWRLISRAFAEIDRLAAEAAAAHRLLDRLDEAILAKDLGGELVPQDPADEPASAFLARIRAERAEAPVVRRRGRRPVPA